MEKRERWAAEMPLMGANRLVFLDESGINTNMIRRYGRSVGKRRVVDHAPINTPKNTTIVSSIRLDGSIVSRTFAGAMTAERFMDYLRTDLVPTLRPGDYVIMDNLRAHKVPGVAEIIRSVEAIPCYLPPYSPDLNPIEMMWSKLKAILRKLRLRSTDLLAIAVDDALDLVSSLDCLGWFSACGYCA